MITPSIDMINKMNSFRDVCECVRNLKKLIFHIFLLNIDISLIITPICLKTCMYISEIFIEESISQNVDKGLSFVL